MNISSVAVDATINYLKSFQELSHRVIVPEFDSNISPIAIGEPIFSVGVENFLATQSPDPNNPGGNSATSGVDQYKLKMRINIYCSFSNGAARAFVSADYIYTLLMIGNFAYRITEIIFDDAQYDSQTESIRLTTHFVIEGAI